MLTTSQLPGRTIWIEGHERLYFSGTSYLGIGHNENFRVLLDEGIHCYGTIYSSSRASNVQLTVYEEAETLLADLTGADAALTFSSGYQAGQAVIQQLEVKHNFLYAPRTHPAVWRSTADATYGDFSAWADTVVERTYASDAPIVIVANSLDPLFAQRHRFDWVAQLPEDRSITVLVDDSHGLGIIGHAGEGIFARLQSLAKPNITVLVVSSLGKAFGVPGGVVFGPKSFVSDLKGGSFFVAGSPVPPAYLYAFCRAQPLYQQARKQLFDNIKRLQEQIAPLPIFRSMSRYPVFYTADNALARGIAPKCVVSSFPYPNPDSAHITRIIVSSLHTREDLDRLGALVQEYARSR